MALADPVDTILVRLSVGYLEEARAVAAAELESFLGHPVELKPASFHPYKGGWFPDLDPVISELVPDFDRGAPFTGVGWIVCGVDGMGLVYGEASRTELPERGRVLCRRLLDGTPRLCLAGGGRTSTLGSSESEHFLAALLADNEIDCVEWIVSSREAATPASTVWDRARKAAHRGDAVEVRTALVEAGRRYSPAGRRMLAIGVLTVLASEIARRQERDNS